VKASTTDGLAVVSPAARRICAELMRSSAKKNSDSVLLMVVVVGVVWVVVWVCVRSCLRDVKLDSGTRQGRVITLSIAMYELTNFRVGDVITVVDVRSFAGAS
jgi:hypothetical protein